MLRDLKMKRAEYIQKNINLQQFIFAHPLTGFKTNPPGICLVIMRFNLRTPGMFLFGEHLIYQCKHIDI